MLLFALAKFKLLADLKFTVNRLFKQFSEESGDILILWPGGGPARPGLGVNTLGNKLSVDRELIHLLSNFLHNFYRSGFESQIA